MNKKTKFTKADINVFRNMGYSEEEAKNLQFRSYLMIILRKYILSMGWSQKEAAERFGITQPRISNLMQGKIYLFSAGVLIELLEKAGFRIYEKITQNINEEFESHHWAYPVEKTEKET
ncbi:MAG: helix-turn-helix transcriptional regulator [Gammaproteobacteria bacterium]